MGPAREGNFPVIIRTTGRKPAIKPNPSAAYHPGRCFELCSVRRSAKRPGTVLGGSIQHFLSSFSDSSRDSPTRKQQWKEVACHGSVRTEIAQHRRRGPQYWRYVLARFPCCVRKGRNQTLFKRVAGDYDYLHLATHGSLNRNAPALSALELEPDAQNDGRLELHEVANMKLHARLVTLSACETALGKGYFTETPAGDEFVGMTRAFLG